MSIRTDIQYKDGSIKVVDHDSGVDTRHTLPEVDRSDLLLSGKYGETWKEEAGGSDPAINALADTQAGMSRSFNTLMELREKQSPNLTQSQHLDSLANDYDKAVNNYGSQMDRAVNYANNRLSEIDTEFKGHIGWSEKDAQELRSVIRNMSDNDKADFISSAVSTGDGQALAAVLGSHPSLVGLTHDQQASYRQRAIRSNAPKLAKLEETIAKARDTTRKTFLDFIERQDQVTAKAVRDKYRQQAEEAAEARKRATGGGSDASESRWNMFTS